MERGVVWLSFRSSTFLLETAKRFIENLEILPAGGTHNTQKFIKRVENVDTRVRSPTCGGVMKLRKTHYVRVWKMQVNSKNWKGSSGLTVYSLTPREDAEKYVEDVHVKSKLVRAGRCPMNCHWETNELFVERSVLQSSVSTYRNRSYIVMIHCGRFLVWRMT